MKTRLELLAILLVCQIFNILCFVRTVSYILAGSERAWWVLRAYDRVGNAAIFGGNDKETISSHADRAMTEGRRWGCVLCKFLDRFETDHCQKSEGV